MNAAAYVRARALWREFRWSTVLIGVLAGLAATVPTAAWAVARRTDRALPAFVSAARTPDLQVMSCPPGYRPETVEVDPESGEDPLTPCMFGGAPADYRALTSLPEVADIAPMSFVAGTLTVSGTPPFIVGMYVPHDPDAPRPIGGGLAVEGRLTDPAAYNEVTIGEWAAQRLDLHPGVPMTFQPFLASQAECASGIPCTPGGPPIALDFVGVVRTPSDLASTRDDEGESVISAGFWDEYDGDRFFRYGTAIAVWTAPGYTVDEASDAIDQFWSDRLVRISPGVLDQVIALPAAISYQVAAARVFAMVSALAVLVVVGQVVARQIRRETDDDPALIAIGATVRDLRRAAAVRTLPTASIAMVVTAAASVALSPLGPIGLARGTQVGPTVVVDWPVVVLGAVTIALYVVGVAAHSARRVARTVPVSARPPLSDARSAQVLGPPALTGLRAAMQPQANGAVNIVTAVVTSAVALAAVVTAGSVIGSLDHLVEHPADYGAPWDVVVGNAASRDDEARAFADLRAAEGVSAAVGIMSVDGLSGGHDMAIVSYTPVPGFDTVEPTITDGRAPTAPNEIALGDTSMRVLGVSIGDPITFASAEMPDREFEATVVGVAVLNDAFGMPAGTGGLVDSEWARSADPTSFASVIGVRLEPGFDRAAIDAAYANSFIVDVYPSTEIQNLLRIDHAGIILAAVIAILAAAALGHAMITSVRLRRRELAALAAIGFRPHQLSASVAWQATFVAAGAVVVGIPLGVAGGRWGWWAICRSVGLTTDPVPVPLLAVVAAVGLVIVANLAAAPGAVLARRHPARALRTE